MSKTWMFLVPALMLLQTGFASIAVATPPAHPPQGTLRITVDNVAEALYVNGEPVALDPLSAHDWMRTSVATFPLLPGRNVIAVKGTDGGVIAGLLAELKVGGSTLVSGEAWRVHHDAPEGWEKPAFDDSAWSSATPYGDHPGGVWGTRVSGMDGAEATWIWNQVNTLNGEIEPVVYFRFTFQVEPGWIATP